jgi:adenosylmethionine-8-amino-7-oxononanoate aminotransferase
MAGERRAIWHPFTQHGLGVPEISVKRAEGSYLYTDDGRAILDAISSWWINLHGHGHPHIAQAIARQAATLDQVIFAGFTHEPAERLARKLLEPAPQGLEHVFFSDSGSTAVEVAIKMAVGCWANRGHPRTRIIALEHAYHGDMFGAMAVGQRGLFNAAYEKMLFEVSFLPFPAHGEEQRTIDALERLLKADAGAFAALIIEPLVLGAGGMKMYRPAVLNDIAQLCRRHEVFLIADEVMTGFGRTGTMFGCRQAGVAPDLMCLSKGLTGGFLPMGATLATGEIFDAFYSKDRTRMFFHSTSYTGNAIACAAALANLEVFEREPVEARIAAIAQHQADAMTRSRKQWPVKDARQCGTIAAIELEVPDGGYFAELSPKLNRFYLEQNVLLRSLGNVVYVLPPYCTTPAELDRIHDAIEASLALLHA